MRFPRSPLPALAIPLLAFVASGCLVGRDNKTSEAGKRVEPDTLSQIMPGTQASRVLELLGEPSERKVGENGAQVWSWLYSKRTESSGYVFLLFGGRDQSTFTQKTFVEIANDKVVRRWQE